VLRQRPQQLSKGCCHQPRTVAYLWPVRKPVVLLAGRRGADCGCNLHLRMRRRLCTPAQLRPTSCTQVRCAVAVYTLRYPNPTLCSSRLASAAPSATGNSSELIDVPVQTLWSGGSTYSALQPSRKPGASSTGGSEARYSCTSAGVLLGPGTKLEVSVMVVFSLFACKRCLPAVRVDCRSMENGRRGGQENNSVGSGIGVSNRVCLHEH
jgi:hypothetical protein